LPETGEPAIRLDRKSAGQLIYRAGPRVDPLTDERRMTLTELPVRALPRALENAALRIEEETDSTERVLMARDFVMERVIYDISESVGAHYAAFFNRTRTVSWLDFVLDFGRGDCDVKNALLVFLLRRLGIPSRLAIGVIGKGGGLSLVCMHGPSTTSEAGGWWMQQEN